MKSETLRGKAHVFGDNINTDLISPAQYMEMSNDVIAAHAMEGADPNFTKKVRQGDILVAGENFGSGSSRETAPIALKICGISVVIAKFFARIFYRNAINLGIPVIECAETDKIDSGDIVEIDFAQGVIVNKTKNQSYICSKIPPHILSLINKGGLVPYLKDALLK